MPTMGLIAVDLEFGPSHELTAHSVYMLDLVQPHADAPGQDLFRNFPCFMPIRVNFYVHLLFTELYSTEELFLDRSV